MEEGGFLYDSDSYADDLPYWVAGPKGPHLVVPYTLDANDMRFAVAQGFNSGDQFFAYLRDSFDVLYAEGARRRRRCCRSACTAGWSGGRGASPRSSASSTMCSSMTASGCTRRIDIARHWHAHHRPK